MAEYDLIKTVSQYFDYHLVNPFLEFIATKTVYDPDEVNRARLQLLERTDMVDYTIDLYKNLLPSKLEEAKKDLMKRRSEVVAVFHEISEKCNGIMDAIGDDATKEYIGSCRDGKQLMEWIINKYPGVSASSADDLYMLAKHYYSCGQYEHASGLLVAHRLVISQSDKNYLNNLWGKLASNILSQDWKSALAEVTNLKEYIEGTGFNCPLKSLQQRTWLIHWSLYVYFNHPQGRDFIIDLFLYQPPYLNAIQTMCPHILRYLTAAVVCNRGKATAFRELVKVIQQENYQYSDPITEFVQCLYVNFDFDGAQKKLRECETVIQNDFFLTACLEDFRENARLLIFETFCRIHECVSIDMLAERLNMEKAEAEVWIVNLIRGARLPAKIDYKLGHVVMGQQATEPYQTLVDKTQDLVLRTQFQVQNLQLKSAQSNPDRVQWSNV
ncbi:eukaryotic translation initiation factor 3 subunit E-A [Galendromus occidentalis]|uniref:Eukaryotic translation initiation factor 3 subunit E n=1 Tax=Galendromus occidentalis TaxID=34638 RepID=A0AAJ6QR11_9ACAR|nr:eukaryotic translation initiation factor 3 subunit E-A [Galendromus occidentalis]